MKNLLAQTRTEVTALHARVRSAADAIATPVAISAYPAAAVVVASSMPAFAAAAMAGTATHEFGLACSPCTVAVKQDRKNNWHGRPLIGRGGFG